MSENNSLSVPIMNRMFTRYRRTYLRQIGQAGADTVFLCPERTFLPERLDREMEELRENLSVLRAAGYRAGVWINAFGFGNPLPAEETAAAPFAKITDLDGRTAGDAFCPLDRRFTAFVAALIRRIAAAGAKLILFDDDLCLSVRPGLGCACPAHMARLGTAPGGEIRREALPALLFAGGPGRLRSAWLRLMGRTLEDFCREMRAAADSVDPDVRVGLCAGYTSWDLEGTDALTLARILAGRGRPLLRLSGAPYWPAVRRFPGQLPCHIAEFSRMQLAWCADSGAELLAENDSYPRPRYAVPAACLETFGFCMAVCGCGQLKYLFDYFSRPDYETGYLQSHRANRALTARAAAVMASMPKLGVYVHEEMRKVGSMAFPAEPLSAADVMRTAFSDAAEFLSGLSVPTTFENGGGVAAAFGDAGRTVPMGQKGYILDCDAALALRARGADVGLAGEPTELATPDEEYFCRANDRVSLAGTADLYDPGLRAGRGYCRARLCPGAEVQSWFLADGEKLPASYFYRNAAGVPFLIFLFRGGAVPHDGALFRSYYRQAQLAAACRRMGGALPAECPGHPGLYLLCGERDGATAVAFCNFSADAIVRPLITLAKPYARAEFFGCAGSLSGRRLRLSGVAAFGFGAAVLR